MEKRTPFYEVARLAEVSPATVSRVAGGNSRVDPAIQARVRLAAERLGVDLNHRNKSRIIAFLLGNRDLLHGFQSRVLAGAESYCASQNWELLFFSFRYASGIPHKELQLPQILARREAPRAVILGGTNSPNLLLALSERGIPFSVLGNNVVGEWHPQRYDVVSSDDVAGAVDVTSYLLSLGHRHIWFVGNTQLPWFSRCAAGYRRAMAAAGLEPHCSEVNADSRELGYLATKMILAQRARVSAIFAGSDQVGHGVYKALIECGARIPDDISVAGLNDTEGVLLHPPLSTVCEFPEELGSHLADFAIKRILNPDLPPQQMTLPTQLVKRESCRPLVWTAEAPAVHGPKGASRRP